ncbi:MAG: DUF3108 domain-containing protein [Deltaproteobacteria bacterium]|nr:DUF3108 domain-containing protein [Deltaproteobacteria bacterium]
MKLILTLVLVLATPPALGKPAAGLSGPRPIGALKRIGTPLVRLPKAAPCPGLGALETQERGFLPGEELAYELNFAGAYIGRFETKVGQPRTSHGTTVLPLFGRARTSAFIAAFKTFEGRYQSMVAASDLGPTEARVEAVYGGDPRWEKILFDGPQRSVKADFLLNGAVQARSYQGSHPLTDILTLLYQARTVRLREGLEACQDVFGSRRLWRMKGRVVGPATISTPAGQKEGWKVATTFERAAHPELNHLPPQRIELDLYVSADAAQTPLRFVARTQGVEAEGQLVRWSLKGTTDEREW